jgi:hypothetical protein
MLFIQLKVTDPGGSERLSAFIENPVLNVSGSIAISVSDGMTDRIDLSLSRFSGLFSHTISGWISVIFIFDFIPEKNKGNYSI